MTTFRYANAPVTWGVWGPHTLPGHRGPDDILRAVSSAGYEGIELGPLGLFGAADTLLATLREYGLRLAGAYVPIRFLEDSRTVAADLAHLDAVCGLLDACGPDAPVILAEETTSAIKRHVARGGTHPELDLTPDEWRTLLAGLEQARTVVGRHGLHDTFHPHTGTHIEQPHEVDRLLESSTVSLTLDTGHAAAGGDDPVALLRRWSDRVDHVHLKDISREPVRRAQQLGTEFGMADASVALGAGDLDLEGFLGELQARRFSGWVVVEQDRRPDGGHDHAAVDEEQHQNLTWIRHRSGVR